MQQFRTSPDTFVYVGSAILFLLPCTLFGLACRGLIQSKARAPLPVWRKYLVIGALGTAGLATVLHIAWNASWLHSGGSPHGMGAGPGIWQPLGPVLVWTFFAATGLSLFGKRKVRALLIGWSVSMYFVFEMIYILQFD
jgi:hypothetical protein